MANTARTAVAIAAISPERSTDTREGYARRCLRARMLRQGVVSNHLPCLFLIRVGNHAGGYVGAHTRYLSVVWVVRSGQREGCVDLGHSGPDGGAFLPVTMPQIRVGLLREFFGFAVVS